MLTLSKPLAPIAILTASFSFAFIMTGINFWWMPMLGSVGYVIYLFQCPKGDAAIVQTYTKQIVRIFYDNRMPIQCNGFGMMGWLSLPKTMKKYQGDALAASTSHEIAHLFYNHPLKNAVYYVVCAAAVSIASYYGGWKSGMIMLACLVPITCFKTIAMEIQADRLANTVSDMRKALAALPNDSIKKIRLAALNGNRKSNTRA